MIKNSSGSLKKYRLHSNTKVEDILSYIFVFLCIYIGRDTLITTSILGFLYSQGLLFICFICLIGVFIYTNIDKIKNIILKDVRIKILVILSFFILCSMIINQDITLRYLSILFCIYISFFINFIMDYKKFLVIFTNILLFLCIFSLVSMYILKPIFIYGIKMFPVFL